MMEGVDCPCWRGRGGSSVIKHGGNVARQQSSSFLYRPFQTFVPRENEKPQEGKVFGAEGK